MRGVQHRPSRAKRSLLAAAALAAGTGWIPRPVLAQNVAVSATAAWSSQIVAFWGAVGIGVRSSTVLQSSNAFTSIFASLTTLWRAKAAMSALRCGEWYLMAPGYNGAAIRLDVVLICWFNPHQLWQACLHVAILAEVVGRQRWLILVVGRQVSTPRIPPAAYWTQSPRHFDFCTTRFADSMAGTYSPFPDEDRLKAIVQHYYAASLQQGQQNGNPNQLIDAIAQLLCDEALMEPKRPTRCAMVTEVPSEVQDSPGGIGRHVTSYHCLHTSGVAMQPYVSVQMDTGSFASNRRFVVISSTLLYCIVHTMVCVAVGLMGAASGRGLAVWLFTPRMVMSKLGAEALAGDDFLLSILGFDRVKFHFQSEAGDVINVAGDAFLPCAASCRHNRSMSILLALLLNLVEVALIGSGWLYGSLEVDKFAPRGVVGHGMLWLATIVATGLSFRTLYGVYQRVSGKLIGIFMETRYERRSVGKDCRIKNLPMSSSKYLGFVSDILAKTEDDASSMAAGLSLMRHPTFSLEVTQHAALECLHYSYQGDTIVKEGNKKITTAGEYPWIQICVCVCLTFLCSVFSAVFAYMDVMPRWSKLLAEVLLATSGIWFTVLGRASKLPHNQSTAICHMVATMVASAVWYVGVKDVG
ncbi:hypothetical protein GOP47_0001075 [Adiantum capillus-veneris]|uniref:Uncharacterized protein n=1 Tax=Adiantum capillus-veneris TaxID=13818 RepID=A0A9D4VFX8_ADICA|nr:hypothetical protein GOP47_0001075 [Adiantum capillus-veneris]